MPSIYIETTIVSYLASRASSDPVLAGHQKVTRDWWDTRRSKFSLYCSQIVVAEARAGDEDAARQRLGLLADLPILEITPVCATLARSLIQRGALPKKAQEDALHISIAAGHGIDYLLTWNCRHIANAEIYRVVTKICDEHGIDAPVICTPDELMGDDSEE